MLALPSWKWRCRDGERSHWETQAGFPTSRTGCSRCKDLANINRGNAFPFTLWFQKSSLTPGNALQSYHMKCWVMFVCIQSRDKWIPFGFHPVLTEECTVTFFFFLNHWLGSVAVKIKQLLFPSPRFLLDQMKLTSTALNNVNTFPRWGSTSSPQEMLQ